MPKIATQSIEGLEQNLFTPNLLPIKGNNMVIKQFETIMIPYTSTLYAERVWHVIASLIGPDDPEYKTYSFSIEEFVNFYNLKDKKIHTNLKKALITLRQTVTLDLDRGRITGWIASGQITDGAVAVVVDPYILPFYKLTKGPDDLQYPAQYLRHFLCYYSYKFYNLFKYKLGNEPQKEIYMNFAELKIWANVEDHYNAYADFKRRILLPMVSDINASESCDISIEYKEVKESRRVVGIKFQVTHLKEIEQMFQLDENTILSTLSAEAIAAYKEFCQISVNKATILSAIKKYGNDGFLKIYQNFKDRDNRGKIRKRADYAASCLIRGYQREDVSQKAAPSYVVQDLPGLDAPLSNEDRQIENLMANLTELEKEEIIKTIKSPDYDPESENLKTVISLLNTWNDFMYAPRGRILVRQYLLKVHGDKLS